MEKFKNGDKIFHKNLEAYGIFEEYDWADNSSCFVTFYEDGHEDFKCVSLNQLIKTDKQIIKHGLF